MVGLTVGPQAVASPVGLPAGAKAVVATVVATGATVVAAGAGGVAAAREAMLAVMAAHTAYSSRGCTVHGLAGWGRQDVY